ncbi:hypothetical protein Franean1_0557 [Parafrankia sp. EAN1pec]|nr:hypothetical protein Franean1_0557 [Frankia sp. EAN1pec]
MCCVDLICVAARAGHGRKEQVGRLPALVPVSYMTRMARWRAVSARQDGRGIVGRGPSMTSVSPEFRSSWAHSEDR